MLEFTIYYSLTLHDEYYHKKVTKKSGLFTGGSLWGSEKSEDITSLKELHASSLNIVGSYSSNSGGDTNIIGSEINVSGNGNITVGLYIDKDGNEQYNKDAKLNILSAENLAETKEKSFSIEAGVKIGVQGDISGAIESVKGLGDINISKAVASAADLTKLLLEGKGIDNALAGNESAINDTMKAVKGIEALTKGPAVSGGITIDADIEGTKSESESKTNTFSNLIAKNNLAITTANQDITIEGANIYAENQAKLDSARDIKISSVQDTSNSSSSSFALGLSIPIAGSGFSIDGSVSSAKSGYVINNNTSIESKDLTLISGRDTEIKGADLKGKDVSLEAGRNFALESEQNTGSSRDFSFGFGVGADSSVSGNLDLIYGKEDRAFVDNQTSITGSNSVKVKVGNDSYIKGVIIANQKEDGTDGGNLTFETKTLTTEDILDYDKGRQIGGGLSASKGIGSNQGQDSAGGSLSYAMHDIRQTNRATIGNGELIIEDTDSFADLNRDIGKAQEITKNLEVKQVEVSYTYKSEELKKQENKQAFISISTFIEFLSFINSVVFQHLRGLRNKRKSPVSSISLILSVLSR